MKLEFKHLVSYPPTLKIMWEGVLCSYEGVDYNNDTVILERVGVPLAEIKLALRPLSDLSKLGDEKTPINEHTINLLIIEKYGVEYGIFSHYKGDLDIELEGDPRQTYDSNKSISLYIILDIYNELLKGHYDVFGLIPQGLAIDINTLEK